MVDQTADRDPAEMTHIEFDPHAVRHFANDLAERGDAYFEHPGYPYLVVLNDVRKQSPEKFPARDFRTKEFHCFTTDLRVKGVAAVTGPKYEEVDFNAHDLSPGESPVERALAILRARILKETGER